MHSMTKVVILLVLFNEIEYSMSEPEPNCEGKNDEKTNTAIECAYLKFGWQFPMLSGSEMAKEPKWALQSGQDVDEKTCCKDYAINCNTVKAVSNTCVCDTTSQLTLL